MKRVITAMLLSFFALCCVAQKSDQANKSSWSEHTAIQGFPGRRDGGYTLTDKAGNRYDLAGDAAQLSDRVGHEVQIKGTVTAPAASSASAATTNATQSEIMSQV